MELTMSTAVLIIIIIAAVGTLSFTITNIVVNVVKLKRERPKVSRLTVELHDAVIKRTKERFKEIGHEVIIIPDDDCVPTNKITTATLIDMKNGAMYLVDRKSAPSGKDILEVCKPGAKIYDLPGDMFAVDDQEVDIDKLYEGAK